MMGGIGSQPPPLGTLPCIPLHRIPISPRELISRLYQGDSSGNQTLFVCVRPYVQCLSSAPPEQCPGRPRHPSESMLSRSLNMRRATLALGLLLAAAIPSYAQLPSQLELVRALRTAGMVDLAVQRLEELK